MEDLGLKEIDNFLTEKNITLSNLQKDFIFIFFQTNSFPLTKNYLNIPLEDCVNIYKDPQVQDILRSLKLLRHREMFKMKMLNLEEIGSFLTNQLLDLNLPEADRLSARDKLEAIKLLLDVHTKINNANQNPIELSSFQVLDMQIKDMSISNIKNLLQQKSNSVKTVSFEKVNNYNSDKENSDVLDMITKQKSVEHLTKKRNEDLSKREIIKKVV